MGLFFNVDEDAIGQPQPGCPPVDLSAFADGDIRFFVKAPDAGVGNFNVKVEFQCKPPGTCSATTGTACWCHGDCPSGEFCEAATQTQLTSIAAQGWDGTNAWQEIAIPLSSFWDPQPVDTVCLENVVSPFMITIENLPFFNSFLVDNVRWHAPNSHPGATSVQVQGRQLLVNGEPFVLNGMAYAPISIGEDWHGALRDRPDRYLVDFPLIAASGANAIRIYSSFLTTAMLDAAWSEGLYVIPTFPVDALQLTCETGKNSMRNRFREMVLEWKDHPAILFWIVGNEVNTNLGPADLCADWFPQLDALALAAHMAEGESFHPVTTSNTELDDICLADCSDDTTLPNLDLWGANLYRGCGLASAFNEYQKPDCARPLIVTEFGADAWDSRLGMESETMQADCLGAILADADQALAVRTPGGVSSGQILFEWVDEWWKAFPADPPVPGFCSETSWTTHDTCKSWENFAYPDPSMNEEWWGITSLDAADPNARGRRAAYDRLGENWQLGTFCDLEVIGYDAASGEISVAFDPAAGSTEHTLYYGPLDAVSSYLYTGSVSGLGANGSSSFTLPPESLFWVVAAQSNGAEGCYGTDSEGVERPCFPDPGSPSVCNVAQATVRSCQQCATP